MTREPTVHPVPGVGAVVGARALLWLSVLAPALEEQLRVNGGDPEAVAVLAAIRVAARVVAADGTVAEPRVPQHAAVSVPQRAAASGSRDDGLTAKQAAAVAGVSERAMRKRGPGLQRAGFAWRAGRGWRFDEAALRRGLEIGR